MKIAMPGTLLLADRRCRARLFMSLGAKTDDAELNPPPGKTNR